jgi:hypothetical protein
LASAKLVVSDQSPDFANGGCSINSGVMHALLELETPDDLLAHPKLDASWEGFALEQVLAVIGRRNAYFWATHGGAELDLILSVTASNSSSRTPPERPGRCASRCTT